MTSIRYRAAVLGFLLCWVHSAQAVIIPYGDFFGATVDYLGVTENTFDEPTALFGAPAVQGDTLDFDPPNFRAFADPGQPSGLTDGQLNLTIMAKDPTVGISLVLVREGGDFTHIGLGPAQAETQVSTLVRFDVLEVNGVVLPAPLSTSLSMTFSPEADGNFDLANYDGSFFWDGLLEFDVGDFLASQMPPVAGNATKIEVVVDNVLTATAANGGSAEILKKDFRGVSIVVPEPSALFFIVVGACCLFWVRQSTTVSSKLVLGSAKGR